MTIRKFAIVALIALSVSAVAVALAPRAEADTCPWYIGWAEYGGYAVWIYDVSPLTSVRFEAPPVMLPSSGWLIQDDCRDYGSIVSNDDCDTCYTFTWD